MKHKLPLSTSSPSVASFETLAQNAPDIICRFDKKYFHVYVNPAIEKATGIPSAVFMGKATHEIGLPPEFVTYWNSKINYVFTQGKQTTMEFSFPTPQGPKFFQSLLVPEYTDFGTVDTVLSISRDITLLKEDEKRKEEFIGIVSHELRTPLTTVKAYTQLLQKRFDKSQDKLSIEYLDKVNKQLDKLTTLVDDLLDATKIESGKINFRKERFDFDQLVYEIIEVMQLTTKHKIVIKDGAKRIIVADRERVGQVLTNLLSNAVKYSPDNKKIIITITNDSKEIMCCIEDRGIGIAKEKLPELFQRFSRVGGAKRDNYPGLGLGLYISSEIIKRQGGKIWVESIEGKGSKFFFSLPRRPQKRISKKN